MDLAQHMPEVARRLLGDPVKSTSTRHVLRFGRGNGSLAVDLRRGVWCDHGAADAAGGVLDLIEHCLGLKGRERLDWLRDIGADIPDDRPAPRVETPADRNKAERDRRFIAATLAGCRPVHGTVVQSYLEWRGCWVADAVDALRFNPAVRHPSGAVVPVMVGTITSATAAADVTGLHMTVMTPDGIGRSSLEPRRWMRGRVAGGVVRLVDDAEVTQGLGIAEGIESAAAVMAAGWRPVWAALSAGNMASLPPLPPLALTAFADQDPAGMAAAEKVVDRWRAAGLEAATAAPLAGDWADIREGSDDA